MRSSSGSPKEFTMIIIKVLRYGLTAFATHLRIINNYYEYFYYGNDARDETRGVVGSPQRRAGLDKDTKEFNLYLGKQEPHCA